MEARMTTVTEPQPTGVGPRTLGAGLTAALLVGVGAGYLAAATLSAPKHLATAAPAPAAVAGAASVGIPDAYRDSRPPAFPFSVHESVTTGAAGSQLDLGSAWADRDSRPPVGVLFGNLSGWGDHDSRPPAAATSGSVSGWADHDSRPAGAPFGDH